MGWFHETYPANDLQPLLLKRCRIWIRPGHLIVAGTRLAKRQRHLDDMSRLTPSSAAAELAPSSGALNGRWVKYKHLQLVAMTGRSGEREGVQRGRGPAVSRRALLEGCGPARERLDRI